jgi:hypothetical protein
MTPADADMMLTVLLVVGGGGGFLLALALAVQDWREWRPRR